MNRLAAPKFDTFTLKNFQLESGVVLPHIGLAYRISGTPSSKPPLLTCTAFSQTYYDLAYLRGPKLALDPKQDWIIHTELLGNGRSSSPSNTLPPFNGTNFPSVTIRDNVALQYTLLQHLGVQEIKAVVGASMGGQQGIQWAVSHPEMVERAVVIVGNCRATWHVRLFLKALANCIRSDPAFQGGNYTTPPLDGLSRMSEAWAPWTFSPEFFARQDYQNYPDTCADSLDEFLAKWRTRYHTNDANDLLCHFQTWSNHDVSLTPGMDGSIEKALGNVKTRVLFLPTRTDAYFPATDVAAEAALVPHSELVVLDTIHGHSAGFGRSKKDREQINQVVSAFLSH
ncbi:MULTISPECIES: alpha/beta fold hydrolase [unclassified Coleofasciculus]|uniref:alpha/beta fold hydrolase n=1 Tax=unclassified Coleofasciculus TaxID=2692782 RepID=UPI0018815181|nr:MULTISPECIES: alpha/beta fold hydrolase [unclassified Coleofasciculus]MBE9128623.1 alpha/beta fold hydrolase [Coleofasciculus sp. LEGE 07081]MBE9151453.1 alpha/beta fold hydrolase [Coleofasciculus sp. LEGE 07092]